MGGGDSLFVFLVGDIQKHKCKVSGDQVELFTEILRFFVFLSSYFFQVTLYGIHSPPMRVTDVVLLVNVEIQLDKCMWTTLRICTQYMFPR